MEVWEKDIELPDGRLKPVTLAHVIAAWLDAGRDRRAARGHWLAHPQTNRKQELSAAESAAIRAHIQSGFALPLSARYVGNFLAGYSSWDEPWPCRRRLYPSIE